MERYMASAPITIGQIEQLAGVEDRAAFWKSLVPVFRQQSTDAGMIEWRKKATVAIRRRVKAGQLSLLYPL